MLCKHARFVADYAFQSEARPMFDFKRQIVETLFETAQSDKFKEAARELGCDEDDARWDERLKKVAKPTPQKKSMPK